MCDKELEQKYDNAIDIVEQHLLSKLNKEQRLELYGLHKQYLAGNCHVAKPSAFVNENRKEAWAAWLKCSGLTKKQCMSKYIALVKGHLKAHPVSVVTKTNNKYGTTYITKDFETLDSKKI